ncbi:MAG: hypothetical protein ACXVDH_07920 [Nocardioides sp.]|jgi:hypothetical protein
MRRLMATLAVLLGMAGLLTACGSTNNADAAGNGTSTDTKPQVIDVTFSGDTVTPNGERVDVAVGQKVQFVVKSDASGEIHVHSTPEKELEYAAGTTELTVGPFDKPGIIEVESHALEKTIVQLKVQ